MANIERTAEARWNGDLRHGRGTIDSTSGVVSGTPYTFSTRFEHHPGTNPEELIAAAHAACYSMAFANTLSKQGYHPQEIHTRATCVLAPQPSGGYQITNMRLETRGKVEGIDGETFKRIAQEADQGCPVSNLLRPGLQIEVDAALL